MKTNNNFNNNQLNSNKKMDNSCNILTVRNKPLLLDSSNNIFSFFNKPPTYKLVNTTYLKTNLC